MYIPKYFQIDDQDIIEDFIEKYSFATLSSQHKGEPYATHLPLVLNKDESVYIPIGTKLHFTRNENIVCEVYDNRKLKYQDNIYSLSQLSS